MSIISRFKRITSSGNYIPFIDGLRFIAIFPVVLTHIFYFIVIKGNVPIETYESNWFNLMKNGGNGVQIFFAISGFVLALPFISYYLGISEKKISLKSYFIRRLTRLEPPYIISMVFFFVILVVVQGQKISELLPHLGASLLYIHNIIYGKGSDINTVAWSLEVEIQFYILAPLIFSIFKRSLFQRRLVIVFSIIVFAVLNTYFDIYYRTLLGQIHFFLMGVLAADIYLSKGSARSNNKLNNPLLFALSIFLLFFVDFKVGLLNLSIFLIGLFLLLLSSIQLNLKNKLLQNEWVCFTGGMCYSIYLIHYPLISFVGNILIKYINTNSIVLEFILYCLIIIPIIFGCSLIFYLLFERPFMDKNWPKKIFKRSV